MLLVFRIFRNCVTKNPSNFYNIVKTDKNDIVTYLKNFTSYTNLKTATITKNHILGIDCIKPRLYNFLQKYYRINKFKFDLNNLTRVTKIDETSVGNLMGNSLSRRRRRRTKLCSKKTSKVVKKRPSKKKRVSKKKLMNNFWLNYQTAPFPSHFVLDSVQKSEITNQNYQFSQFPPLNPNLLLDYVPPSRELNCFQLSHQESKSYSDVVKTVTLHSEGTDLKQFLAEARQDVYTPYGEWVKEGWYKDKAEGVFIKILSYNILAQNLLNMHPQLYRKHDPKYLDWEYRKNALLKEFQDFDADVLCLQEVEGKETDFFNTNLEALGYKGIYKKRTNDKQDGCAIYYRVEKFDLKEYATVEYYQPGIQLLNRDNIGLIARLSPKKSPDKNIVVANTHLLFNPRRHDIKLAQIQMMLAEIDRIAYRSDNNSKSFTLYHPVVLVGDFNLKPFTYVYDLVVNGYLENIQGVFPSRRFNNFNDRSYLMPIYLGITDACQHYEVVKNRPKFRTEISDFKFVRLFNSDRKSLSFSDQQLERKEKMDNQFFGSGYLYHNLNFTSVYPHDHFRGENATTFQDDWCNVDYIFYGPRRMRNGVRQDGDLKLVSYLRLPTAREAETLKTIPNEACASDHLPLLATFFLPTC